MAEVDRLLFEADRWFAIDARNTKVPGVAPGTLDQALALVGRGRVATIVGQLRPEVLAVDIDADGALGDTAAELLRDWCAARGLWHLQRASGGGPGRWHLLVVPGVHADALTDKIAAVRRELRLTSTQLDPRTHLRPLSAPHRRTGALTPPEGLKRALSGLQSVLDAVSRLGRARTGRSGRPEQRSETGGPAEPLTPLPRPRRDLPLPWASYLARGRRAAAAVDRDPTTRSLLELQATTALVLAGYTEAEAWQAITTAHRGAFTKARSRGRRWWWHVWNRAVVDADTWLRARRASAPTTAPAQPATTAARTALDALWRSWPPRTRHTDHEILTVVLDRMDRVGATAVPIPQRDLVLDCAVASRTTVRASLARLQAAGLLHVQATYVPGTTDTAHTLQLPEQLPHRGSAVSPTGPSRFQPPHRRPPLPLRRALGPPAAAVLAHLPDHDAQGSALDHLAHVAGLLDHDQGTPSPRQLRTARAHLRALARHGLASVDEHGKWRATAGTLEPTGSDAAATATQASPEASAGARVHQLGQALDARTRERVDAERAEFRARVDPQARMARWEQQRHAALARAAKAARARQKAWWNAQPTAVAARRRTALEAAFAALPPPQQAQHKQHLAQQRARAGEDERARYDAWLATLSPTDLDQRSTTHALAYARRPAHEQHQLVASWTDHRARWQLPHPPRRTTAAPPAKPAPETALMQRPVPSMEELLVLDAAQLRAHVDDQAETA